MEPALPNLYAVVHDECQGTIREGIRNVEREILLHDLALPLLSFVIMTFYNEISRLLL